MKAVKKIKRICKSCGESFEVLPCRVKEGKGIFCSRSCAMKQSNNPNWIGGTVNKICRVCGEEFEILVCRIKRGEGKYCSLKCLGKANGNQLQEKIKGDKNPNWQGGIETENHKIRTSLRYEEWRQYIFKRDNYTCQVCSEKGGKLNAHHIETFNGNPKLRVEINNGITLCEDCHRDFHHQYGNNCTKEQFNKFRRKLK